MMSVDEMRDTLSEEIEEYFEAGMEQQVEPSPWMHYIFQDAGISVGSIGSYYEDPDSMLKRSFMKVSLEQIDYASKPQIEFYMGARDYGFEWV